MTLPNSASPPPPPLRLGVLISGGGTTLANLQERIEAGNLPAVISVVIASRECAGVQRARELGLNAEMISRKNFANTEDFSRTGFGRCREAGVELVVLGGFLHQISIPDDYVNRVINIHPSLIPAFCGRGMFGHRVHEAVIARGCKISGCTVHFCDNEYDHGPIILQRCVPVLDGDDAEALAARVFAAECEALPEAIRLFAERRLSVHGRRVLISRD